MNDQSFSTVGIEFTETMRGYFSQGTEEDFEAAAQRGKKEQSRFEFTLTVAIYDLARMLSDEDHPGEITGTVSATALDAEPLVVTDGKFHLFMKDPERVRARKMIYRLKLKTVSGRPYYFDGFKDVHDDPGLDMWKDTTTLFITVYEGEDYQGPVVGRGILRILLKDFGRQLASIRVTGASGAGERVKAIADFSRFFLGELYQVYGKLFAS